MNILVAEGIHKSFGENFKALSDINLAIPEASIFGLLGPNGAGKTTFIRIINQILAPDEGTVYLNQRKISPKDIESIGYLPEERGLYKKMKVGEQALYLAQLKGLSKADALKRLKHWFVKLEIEPWWNKKVEELSKGMQQKVQFVTTVLHEPKLLIFDEPFSGFDPINANILKREILELKAKGSTIIFSTHNMSSVEELCDSIALINQSSVILKGQMEDIKKQFKTNLYELVFEGSFNKLQATLSSEYEIVEATIKEDKHQIKVRLLHDLTTNELIQILLPLGNLIGFKEVIPSMNDIFIQVVEQAGLRKPDFAN
jgi:ABC-2 type transport system ATP-binding protein